MAQIKELHGFENVYVEQLSGTDEWICCSENTEIEPTDIFEEKLEYIGTRLRLVRLSDAKIYEPIFQEEGVYLQTPVYNNGRFEILKYDFKNYRIELIEYIVSDEQCNKLCELSMNVFENLINLRVIVSPPTLIKFNEEYEIEILWPEKLKYKGEINETLDFRDNDVLYMSKWIDEPEYREEVIVRDYPSFKAKERYMGSICVMSDGVYWKFIK